MGIFTISVQGNFSLDFIIHTIRYPIYLYSYYLLSHSLRGGATVSGQGGPQEREKKNLGCAATVLLQC
jgi:hypothetical protein